MLTTGISNPEHAAGWTEERVGKLKALWGEGKSASEIAVLLGGGLTRSAVIGKVHRLKIDGRSKPTKKPAAKKATLPGPARQERNGSYRQPKAVVIQHRLNTVQKPKPIPVPVDLPEPSKRLRLADIRSDQCAWCDGDPLTPEHSFCGRLVHLGTSWCSHHHAIVYPSR